MTTPEDVMPEPPELALGILPADDEASSAASVFQEINERRARVENAELLHHLRGL